MHRIKLPLISPCRIPGLWIQCRMLSWARGSMELPDLAQNIMEEPILPWHWGIRSIFWVQNFHMNFHFWAQNFHFLSAESWAVCLVHHCSFWVQNFHFLSIKFPFLRAECRFLVWNLHFLSAEFWLIYLEQFLRAKYAFFVSRIPIFEIFLARDLDFSERRISIFGARNSQGPV